MQRYRSRNQDECVRPRGCPGSEGTVPVSDPSLGRVVVEPDHSGASKCPQVLGRWSRRLVRLQVPLLDAQSCACELRVRVEGSQTVRQHVPSRVPRQTRRLRVWVVGRPNGRVWTGPRGRSAAPVAFGAALGHKVASYLFENGGDPRLWLQQGQGSRKGWPRTVGPCTSSGMSRMLCPRRGGGSVEVCTMKATSVAKRQCTGSVHAGQLGPAAAMMMQEEQTTRARQYVQGGCNQVNGDAAHL